MLMVSVKRDNSWQSSRIKQRQKNCSVRGSVRTGGSNSVKIGSAANQRMQCRSASCPKWNVKRRTRGRWIGPDCQRKDVNLDNGC
jgi:hypothetical protein